MTLVFGEMAVSGEDCCILARKSQSCGGVKKSKRGREKKHDKDSKNPTSIENRKYSFLPDSAPRGIVASRNKKLDNGSVDLRVEAVGMVARLVKGDEQVVEEVDLVPRGRGQSRSRIRGQSSFARHGGCFVC